MKKSLRIPIAAAKEFAKKYGKDQVIILCYDNETETQWITTYGKTIKDCELAARSGNNLKRFMRWPEGLCHDTPARLKARGIKL